MMTYVISFKRICSWLFFGFMIDVPVNMIKTMLTHRDLLIQLVQRDFQSRYKGTLLGFFWSILTPVFMLSIYSFVFGVIFNGAQVFQLTSQSKLAYPLVLFCGISVYGLFSDCSIRSPSIILRNTNLVTKVVFPLEIIPVSIFLSSLIHSGLNLLICYLIYCIFVGGQGFLALSAIVTLVPLFAICLGMGWFLSALGVFLRDMEHIISVLVQLLFFVSAVFFPISAVTGNLNVFMKLNPLSVIIESIRNQLLLGREIPLGWFLFSFVFAIVFMVSGYYFFTRCKSAFADVL